MVKKKTRIDPRVSRVFFRTLGISTSGMRRDLVYSFVTKSSIEPKGDFKDGGHRFAVRRIELKVRGRLYRDRRFFVGSTRRVY